MIRLALAIVVVISIQSTSLSQRSLLDIEKYYLQELFDSASQNKIKELIERNSEKVILRKWIFDNTGKLKKELDLRRRSVIRNMSGIESNVSDSQKRTYSFSYDSRGRQSKIVKEDISDGDTTSMEFLFQNPGKDTIMESSSLYEIISYGEIEMELDIAIKTCSLKVNNRIDSISTQWFFKGVRTGIDHVKYVYDRYGKLTNKNFKYEIKSELEETEYSFARTNFKYDSMDRLERVTTLEQDNLMFDHHLFYNSESLKLQRIESRGLQNLTSEIIYNSKGFLEKVIANNRELYYEIVKSDK